MPVDAFRYCRWICEPYRYELLSDSFSMSLAIAFPQQGQFQIEYRKANGEVALQAVQGVVRGVKASDAFCCVWQPPFTVSHRSSL